MLVLRVLERLKEFLGEIWIFICDLGFGSSLKLLKTILDYDLFVIGSFFAYLDVEY